MVPNHLNNSAHITIATLCGSVKPCRHLDTWVVFIVTEPPLTLHTPYFLICFWRSFAEPYNRIFASALILLSRLSHFVVDVFLSWSSSDISPSSLPLTLFFSSLVLLSASPLFPSSLSLRSSSLFFCCTDEAKEKMESAKIRCWNKTHKNMKWKLALRIATSPSDSG